ncbi:recombinase family protein [Desulfitibacter alkalitolerans]|uniref:recombinase family protein n=1 Tax=Desulfitibacter alkalitolerans TaxID=264641 RepID=UPI0006868660|nr:recombinase family protein [Desulfitibacter alkalitolerans]
MSGLNIGLIIRELEKRGIKTPQGKDIWSKKSIKTVLGNEKYIGHVLLGKTYTGDFPNNRQFMNDGEHEQFLMKDAHEPIIELKKYEKVQEEMKRRSNIEIVNGAVKRKDTHYSSKRKKQE